MGYYFDSRVRFSEADENGYLTLPGVLDYFQDCCTFQAESIHQGQRDLLKRSRVWVLSAWQIDILRFPEQGETIRTTTIPYKLRGFLGLRNFTMDTLEGERLAVANSIWTNLNSETGLPERLTETDLEGYVIEDQIDMEYAPRRIAVPEDCTAEESFVIQKHHLDSNHHVNNGQYVRMAQDYLPEGFALHRMRAEYKSQGFLGDTFYPMVSYGENRIFVSFNNAEGNPYAVVEFT